MSDYIKREDAITVIYGQHVGGKEACENARPNTFGADLREIVSDIEDIPAANVVERELYERALSDVIDLSMKQKTGKWISMMGHSVCNVCGYKGSPILTNYCPNCGADMRGES